MKVVLLCFALSFAVASGAGVFGAINVAPNGVGAQGGFTFPRIPFVNTPGPFGLQIFPHNDQQQGQQGETGQQGQQGQTGQTGQQGQSSSQSPSFNLGSLPDPLGFFKSHNNNAQNQRQGQSQFTIPNVKDLIPQIPFDFNGTNITVPEISLPSIPDIPGLREALNEARDHLNLTLGIGSDFVQGIQQAIEEALSGDEPTTAIRTLVTTILDTYLAVARNCPMIVIGFRVLQEGIRLAGEVARSVQRVITGNST